MSVSISSAMRFLYFLIMFSMLEICAKYNALFQYNTVSIPQLLGKLFRNFWIWGGGGLYQ